ncbi:MAG TPA: glycosyltransferase [Pyrinomonadaceae bacterium]|nr:glycosyltransferase [Pyrinomonadaceae bacterium]
MKVSVVIPTHNRSDALRLTLLNLAGQEFDQPWELIVVNNRSTDDTDAVVASVPFPVELTLLHEEKPGAAAARNAGLARARGEYLVFMDNDILVGPDFLRRHVEALERNPGCWVVGGIAGLPEHEAAPFGQFRKALASEWQQHEVTEATGLTGANFSAPRPSLISLGGFDEDFAIASQEDLELAVRAWNAGIKILLHPTIIGVHNDWAGSSIDDYCHRVRSYARTEPLFWRKYGDDYCHRDLLRENLPPAWGSDSPHTIFKKMIKGCAGAGPAQAVLLKACHLLESTVPFRPVLWRLYRLALVGATYRGIQEGLAMYASDYSPGAAGKGGGPLPNRS